MWEVLCWGFCLCYLLTQNETSTATLMVTSLEEQAATSKIKCEMDYLQNKVYMGDQLSYPSTAFDAEL